MLEKEAWFVVHGLVVVDKKGSVWALRLGRNSSLKSELINTFSMGLSNLVDH